VLADRHASEPPDRQSGREASLVAFIKVLMLGVAISVPW